MIEVFNQNVFNLKHALKLFSQRLFVKELADLKACLRVFIRIKRRDARFCGAEACLAEALLLVNIKKHMIRHDHLAALGNYKLGCGNALFNYAVIFL